MLGFWDLCRIDLALYVFTFWQSGLFILCLLRFQKRWGVLTSLGRVFSCLLSLQNSSLSQWLVFDLTTVYHSKACCFFCCWIWVKVKSQNWLNVEMSHRKAVRNCGHDLSPNPPITLLPSIREPNFTNQCWSSGTANDEMMSELLEGWKYMTRKRQVFPESQYECDRWSIGSYAWPYARSMGEIGIFS